MPMPLHPANTTGGQHSAAVMSDFGVICYEVVQSFLVQLEGCMMVV